MFASRKIESVSLPSDPAVLVTIRKLSWTQRDAARLALKTRLAREMQDMGGAAALSAAYEVGAIVSAALEAAAARAQAAVSDRPPPAPPPAEAPAAPPADVPDLHDPLALYDQATVLQFGVVAWPDPTPVTPEALNDLAAEDAEYLARRILALSVPPPRSAEQEKNAGCPSTAV